MKKAYIMTKDGEKHWFTVSDEMAEKIKRLQALIRTERIKKSQSQEQNIGIIKK